MANFAEQNIQLKITDKVKNSSYFFKAYLEKSDISVKILDTNLQYAPISYTNNTQFLKTQYTVDFSFNVFAETLEEAKQNYNKLHDLLNSVKPSYNYLNSQLLPYSQNIFGLLSVHFLGIPRLSKTTRDLDIYVTNFVYSMNKDMGFVQDNNNELIPVAYKIDLSGRVLLSIDESANIPDYKKVVATDTPAFTDILKQTVGGDEKYQQDILNMAKNIIGEKFTTLTEAIQRQILKELKQAKDSFILDETGQPSKWGRNKKPYSADDLRQVSSNANNYITSIKQKAGI